MASLEGPTDASEKSPRTRWSRDALSARRDQLELAQFRTEVFCDLARSESDVCLVLNIIDNVGVWKYELDVVDAVEGQRTNVTTDTG